MTNRFVFGRRGAVRSRLKTALMACSLLALLSAGCAKTNSKSEPGGQTDIPAPGSLFVPEVETVAVRGEDFVEHIELPGVSVFGMESTPLHAKVGGFVKEIRRVGRTTIDGVIVQMTDTADRLNYRIRDIEVRVVGPPKGKTAPRIIQAASPEELKQIWPALYDAWQQVEMMEIDVGSYVEAGTLLAVLDIPEMADGIRKQNAVIERANQTVAQKQAAIRSASAEVGKSLAEIAQARKARDEVSARLQRDQKELGRIEQLGRNIDRAFLEQLQFKVAASKAALASAEQMIKSAEETVKVSRASVDKAAADKNVAAAFVTESKAELSRLETLRKYASIRAPFSGTINRRFVDHGSFVRPAQQNSGAKPLFAITQTNHVRVVIPVPGRKSYKIRPGQEVVFHTIGGMPGVTIEGTITRSSATLDPSSRMMRAEMHLTNPATNSRFVRDGRGWKARESAGSKQKSKPKVTVRPGMFGVVTVRNPWKQLRMVPASAVAGEGDRQYLLEVVKSDTGKPTVIKRFVTVVFNDASVVGISDGIPVGAEIVANGVSSLKDGQEILLKKE